MRNRGVFWVTMPVWLRFWSDAKVIPTIDCACEALATTRPKHGGDRVMRKRYDGKPNSAACWREDRVQARPMTTSEEI